MIYKATPIDVPAIAKLAHLLWPDDSVAALTDDFRNTISDADAAVFLYELSGTPVGFAQCQLRRDYVEGTSTSPVGYLEAIFVKEEYRNRGFAKELLAKCEAWAKEKGCSEFASDCELENEASIAFHSRLGFSEANRIVCFTKSLE